MKAIALAALAAAVVPGVAAGASTTTELLPGVTYEREVRRTSAGPIVIHAITAPRPGGLYDVRPVLSNEMLIGKETVSSMQRRLSGRATLTGVNGDLFNPTIGNPSGMFMRGGRLVTRPFGGRSSLGFGLDSLLRVGRIRFFGSWRVGDNPRHPVFQFNRPLAENKDLGVFTRAWGPRTPRLRRGVEVVLGSVPPTVPNVDLRTEIVAIRRSTGGSIPAGGAVVQARKYWRIGLLAEARVGRPMTIHLKLQPWWNGAVDAAIGGGPLLVRNGTPIFSAGEEFTSSQLRLRHPRTAVGQRADGRLIFLAVDGRYAGSIGMRMSQLAAEMAQRGAQTAMALDSGGSTTLAFDGRVLNRPSDGRERAVSNGVMVFYYGAYARPPRYGVFSPNGDGVTDVQRLAAKFVRRSNVDIRIVRPNGNVHWRFQDLVGRGTITRLLGGTNLPEGTWRWVVHAVDMDGRESQMERTFTLNNTLGHLRLSKTRMTVRRRRGGRIVASWRLANRADIRVRVENAAGRSVRRLAARSDLAPGSYAVVWNGKNRLGRVVQSGVYRIEVKAENGLGRVLLEKRFVVRRVRS
jgi:hypothetical protein